MKTILPSRFQDLAFNFLQAFFDFFFLIIFTCHWFLYFMLPFLMSVFFFLLLWFILTKNQIYDYQVTQFFALTGWKIFFALKICLIIEFWIQIIFPQEFEFLAFPPYHLALLIIFHSPFFIGDLLYFFSSRARVIKNRELESINLFLICLFLQM